MTKVLIINDRAELNTLYRSSLMDEIRSRGYQLESIGLFDGIFRVLLVFVRLIMPLGLVVVSSNLRTNAAVLCIPWLKGLVILNGLGRYRQSRGVLSVLRMLVRINPRKTIAVQSYADYRWMRRQRPAARLVWVPGSGGRRREIGGRQGFVAVQRNSKLPIVAQSLLGFLTLLKQDETLYLVGCTDSDLVERELGEDVVMKGFVPSEDLFTDGSNFVQPSGYGEGVPHSLVDAIQSDMTIFLPKREAIRYGLSRLGAETEPVSPGWVKVRPSEKLKLSVQSGAVTKLYMDALTTHL